MFAPAVYFVAMSQNPDGGIYRYEMESETSLPKQVGFNPLSNANYLCFSPNRNFLYATCATEKSGAVASFRINSDHSLNFINLVETNGLSTCHLLVNPAATFLYCVNYRTGSVTEIALNPDGSLGKVTQTVQHHGKGVNEKRQEGPHTHCTILTPDQKYLTVIDLGIDSIKTYAIDPVKGLDPASVKTCKLVDGVGPRHLLFDQSGKIAYLVNELGNSVTSLRYNDGVYTPIKTFSSLPAGTPADVSKASAIRLSPDQRFLFASNRAFEKNSGYDTIACYRVLGDGELKLYDVVDAHGNSPRDFDFLPGGKLVAVHNEFTDNVCYYSYEPKSGILTYLDGKDVKLPRPLCVLY